MITSYLEFVRSNVTFTEELSGEEIDESIAKLDTGFFSLFLNSQITIRDNCRISNLRALNEAVLSAQSMSSVTISNEVYFLNNKALSSKGQTIALKNTDLVEISGAIFDGNE